MNLVKVTGEGQLEKGDRLRIVAKASKNNYESVTVKRIVHSDYGEEIIINIKRNYYFVTKWIGEVGSWTKEVYKIVESAA